jgi:hypothetical protein
LILLGLYRQTFRCFPSFQKLTDTAREPIFLEFSRRRKCQKIVGDFIAEAVKTGDGKKFPTVGKQSAGGRKNKYFDSPADHAD